MVVRESMAMDLLDRLISDLISVTQTLMESDLRTLQPAATATEKVHQSRGVDAKHRHRHESHRPLAAGVHRTVC